jgi:hypothetical protein
MSLSPSLEQARAHKWAVLAVLSISLVVVVVGNVSLNVARRDLGRRRRRERRPWRRCSTR